MKKKILSLLLFVCTALGCFAGCDLPFLNNKDDSSSTIEEVDYAGEVALNETAESQTAEVTVKSYIDGDTTHFWIDEDIIEAGILKARYAAVNTPESTGQIEEWGKKAANFTKSRLQSAKSIIIETDGATWEVDSTGDRYLVWIWYMPEGSDTYRNLNIELLQNGLGIGSGTVDCRYEDAATQAIYQASVLKLNVHSPENDPDFYYGEALEIDLKELRLNIEEYESKKVAFEGYVSYYSNNGVYVENYDEESELWYGIYVYCSYIYAQDNKFQEILAVGNKVRIVGKCSYWETGDSYQISDVKYRRAVPKDPDNIQKLDDEKYPAANVETSAATFKSTVTLDLEEEKKAFPYAQLVLGTSISMKNLVVVDTYTTVSETDSNGEITLTCQVDGQTIKIHTSVLKNADGTIVTEDQFQGKTLDVKGIVDVFKGDYQIKVFSMSQIVIH